jgi:hypothetical protein
MKKYLYAALPIILMVITAHAHMTGMHLTQLPGGGGTGDGGACSGTYGNATQNTDYTNTVAAKTIITKVVLDCTGSNPTIGGYAYWIHEADHEVIFVVYDDDSGPNDLVCQTNATTDNTIGPDAHSSSDWTATCNLSAGTYYIGAQLESDDSRFYKSDSGENIRYVSAAGTFGTPPSSWDPNTDTSDTDNYAFTLSF